MYFVTVCTKNMEQWFGRVIDKKMKLNVLGQIVRNEWIKTGKIRNQVELDEWIIMPNHFHGIILLKGETTAGRDVERNVSTSEFMSHISPNKGSLSTIIRSFKSACTKQIRKHHNPNLAWQSRFYDHIIRNETALKIIRIYIKQNPHNRGSDRNNQTVDTGRFYLIESTKGKPQ